MAFPGVPRFYLDIVVEGVVVEDPDGVEFPDLDTALVEATLGARELVAHGIMRNEDVSGQSFVIRDGTGPLVVDAKVNPAVYGEWLADAFRGG